MSDSAKIILTAILIAIIAIIALVLIKWIMAHLGIAAIILLIGLALAFIIGKK